LKEVFIDSAVIGVHRHTAGAPTKTAPRRSIAPVVGWPPSFMPASMGLGIQFGVCSVPETPTLWPRPSRCSGLEVEKVVSDKVYGSRAFDRADPRSQSAGGNSSLALR